MFSVICCVVPVLQGKRCLVTSEGLKLGLKTWRSATPSTCKSLLNRHKAMKQVRRFFSWSIFVQEALWKTLVTSLENSLINNLLNILLSNRKWGDLSVWFVKQWRIITYNLQDIRLQITKVWYKEGTQWIKVSFHADCRSILTERFPSVALVQWRCSVNVDRCRNSIASHATSVVNTSYWNVRSLFWMCVGN
jgi:hypothetical protein